MSGVSKTRLVLLRGTYLIIGIYLGSSIVPLLFHHTVHWDIMHGVGVCLLSAMVPLVVVGLRWPLQMLPVLLFELIWKTTWLAAVAFPMWRAGGIDADTMETVKACGLGLVLFPLIIPWPYVFKTYALGQNVTSGTAQ